MRHVSPPSALQQPRHAGEQTPRRFVGFPFRLHAHPQADGARNVRRLDRKVMCKGEDERLDGVESSSTFIGFLPGKPLTTVTFTSE